MQISRSVIQDPKLGWVGAVASALEEAADFADFESVRISVAYATVGGVDEYLFRVGSWHKDARKRWLVSIDYGHTDPDALERLASLKRSAVRIPNCSALLQRKLLPVSCFHPKSYLFGSTADASGAGEEPSVAHLVTSANLTFGGLISNSEHGHLAGATSSAGAGSAGIRGEHDQLVRWFDRAWESAERLTDNVLVRYRALRRPLVALVDDEELPRALSAPGAATMDLGQAARWRLARCFWIETEELYKNRGRFHAGNQLDCARGTRVYFGFAPVEVARNTVLGSIVIECAGYQAQERSVRFGNNMMDKVNLPIPDEYGPADYDHKVLHFERIGPKHFVLTFGDSARAQQWRAKSVAENQSFEFSRGRRYGFYG